MRTAFRDNGDGSLSAVGTCDVSMVVKQMRPVVGAGVTGPRTPQHRRNIRRRGTVSRNVRARLNRREQRADGYNDIDRHIYSDIETDRNEPDEQRQNGTAATDSSHNNAASPTADDARAVFVKKRRALMALEDPSADINADTIDASAEQLQTRNRTQDNVYIFPSTFWKSQGDRPSPALPTQRPLLAKDRDSLVFPIYHEHGDSKGWYGVFVQRRAPMKFVFAVVDPTHPTDAWKTTEAIDIFRFLQAQGCLCDHPAASFFNPDPGLPRAAHGSSDAHSGVSFLRALSCFLHSPKAFFDSAVHGVPLRWARTSSRVASAAHMTRASILDDLKETIHRDFVDEAIQDFVSRVDEYANGQAQEKRHLLILHAEAAGRAATQLVEESQDSPPESRTNGADAADATAGATASDAPVAATSAATATSSAPAVSRENVVDGHATVPATRPRSTRASSPSYSHFFPRSLSRTVTPRPAGPATPAATPAATAAPGAQPTSTVAAEIFVRAATAEMEVDEELDVREVPPPNVRGSVVDTDGESRTNNVFVVLGSRSHSS
ncbi:hypothetical protein SPBR_08345 [Sporothrix brasiliensis 5110]|uniref:Uncharacterized protein n=1 Tax=Sporothrix brasiliensis 5110 TaxID=1398154 RepID=A0A0C2F6C0_9PEZI|nr:uncharacterized protein SPBR_08345 [Sporothrix brasiliensis 5110]KIH86543.1 hypothetical protein SPBR_08345 [Sporothrix brasiliensis 5110]